MTSIASQLARDIEIFAARLRATHPLLELAQQGRFSPEGVACYLKNARFLIEHTPRHLEAARERAMELSDSGLARFFEEKLVEETGHDVWATNDLAMLKQLFAVEAPAPPSVHLQNLVHSLERTIAEQPRRYLSYMLFIEYLTVLLGPIWLSLLSERCGVPVRALSVVKKHVELDVAHVATELREFDTLLRGEDSHACVDVLHRSMRFFELFCDELFERFGSSSEPAAAE